jgi:hypothetical protein
MCITWLNVFWGLGLKFMVCILKLVGVDDGGASIKIAIKAKDMEIFKFYS